MGETTKIDRPILFSAPMVRALLAGTKTQTRRIVKLPEWLTQEYSRFGAREILAELSCPYGKFGDRLWCKETWRPRLAHACGTDVCDCDDVNVTYAADGEERFFRGSEADHAWEMPKAAARGNVSPLFMPRWASRITMELTEVRVERLRDITEEDARAEGVTPIPYDPEGDCWSDGKHSTAFNYLWNELHGWAPNAVDANPWVWALTFRRVDQPQPQEHVRHAEVPRKSR